MFSTLAGLCDASTGLLLLIAPMFTLRLMGISHLPLEPIYMRFIGTFVFSVGSLYLLPFLADRRKRDLRLANVLACTAFIRVCIASFIVVSVALGALVVGWSAVLLTDASFAAIQIWILKRDLLGVSQHA